MIINNLIYNSTLSFYSMKQKDQYYKSNSYRNDLYKIRGSLREAKEEQIIEILIKRGSELLKKPYKKIEFTGNLKADDLLNDIDHFPHAFVLACIMDRQIKAEKDWLIPYKISEKIKGFEFFKASTTQSE